MSVAGVAVAAIALYTAIGAVFAMVFAVRGRLPLGAVGARLPIKVRLVLMPGAGALWPLLLLLRRPTGEAAS